MIAMLHGKKELYQLFDYRGNKIAEGLYAQILRTVELTYPVQLEITHGGELLLDGELIATIVKAPNKKGRK